MKTNNIRNIRERIGLSQSEFAKAVGVSQGNISHYEKQRQEVSPAVARRIIVAAKKRGVFVSFDDVYVANESANEATA